VETTPFPGKKFIPEKKEKMSIIADQVAGNESSL
jgi:hypothetical protein